MEKTSLEKLKKQYSTLQKKYKLPSFSELNKEFDIEKLQERETDFLLREIRRIMGEKMNAFLRFLETVLNPVMAPVFILSSLKNLGASDKELIEKNYKILVGLELKSIGLDIEYNEKKEAFFILETIKKWQEMKEEIEEIIKSLAKIQYHSEKKGSYLG
jgi:hypothetical protein